tara:strand:+ start:1471 stop:2028 length:558 start_codon:yes stop_codon:yes gene_type:complete
MNTIVTLLKPFLIIINKTIFYKKGSLILFSASASVILKSIMDLLNGSLFGVSNSFLLLIAVLFVADFLTGIAASRHEENKAITIEEQNDKKFKSSKITFTFFKFLMLFLWVWLADSIGDKIENVNSLKYLYDIIIIIPLILLSLREYVSIGENLERKYNKKPYLFSLADKIFKLLESDFLNKLKK